MRWQLLTHTPTHTTISYGVEQFTTAVTETISTEQTRHIAQIKRFFITHTNTHKPPIFFCLTISITHTDTHLLVQCVCRCICNNLLYRHLISTHIHSVVLCNTTFINNRFKQNMCVYIYVNMNASATFYDVKRASDAKE